MALKNINLAPIAKERIKDVSLEVLAVGNANGSALQHETSEIEPQPSEADVSVDGLTEAEVQEPQPVEPEPQTTDKPIAAVPTIQDPDPREKELDYLISKLSEVNRHWNIIEAREKGVSMKALLHAATLWLSDDMDDWTAANDTIYSFTSPYGLKQLQYPSKTPPAIPNHREGKN